jgi:hypothetical protein
MDSPKMLAQLGERFFALFDYYDPETHFLGRAQRGQPAA